MRVTTLRHDDVLGRWSCHEWKPPPLAGLVDRFWYSAGSASMPRKRIVPNGMVELIVPLGDLVERRRAAASAGERSRLVHDWVRSRVAPARAVADFSPRHRRRAALQRGA